MNPCDPLALKASVKLQVADWLVGKSAHKALDSCTEDQHREWNTNQRIEDTERLPGVCERSGISIT